MTVSLQLFGDLVYAFDGIRKIGIIAAHFSKGEVWVFNADSKLFPNLHELKDLFLIQFNPKKVVDLNVTFSCLTRYNTSTLTGLRMLFNDGSCCLLEENAKGLKELAEILKIRFNGKEFEERARKAEFEFLHNSVKNLVVPIPKKLKKRDPFIYAKLKLMRLSAIQEALKELND